VTNDARAAESRHSVLEMGRYIVSIWTLDSSRSRSSVKIQNLSNYRDINLLAFFHSLSGSSNLQLHNCNMAAGFRGGYRLTGVGACRLVHAL